MITKSDGIVPPEVDAANRQKVPKPFILVRDEDATGISGTGIVAGGVLFPDGVVALRWYSDWPTSVVFHDKGMDAVEHVHGHGGKTRIVYVGDLWR